MPTPRHRLHVWPWLRAPAQRLILKDWLAITIWDRIFAWRDLDEAELAHELTHVAQWRRHGALFVARYLLASRRASGIGGDRYRDNEFEVEAHTAEDLVRAKLTGVGGDFRPT